MDIFSLLQHLVAIIFCCLHLTKEVVSVEITIFEVPKMAVIGRSYELKCSIDSKSGVLATIKWYKNNTEFYRREFKPNKVKFFNTKGVKINKEKTMNGSLLVIDDVDYDSEGVYKCEVTEERSFNTDEKESQMLVTNMNSRAFTPSVVYKEHRIVVLLLTTLTFISLH